ncbi:MAG: hypothetical protein ACC661_03100, partial [Verrucomicrobiales bacterium]
MFFTSATWRLWPFEFPLADAVRGGLGTTRPAFVLRASEAVSLPPAWILNSAVRAGIVSEFVYIRVHSWLIPEPHFPMSTARTASITR